ncbi:FadR/GntR family transcriptional regulator [Rhodovulum steppense]|uniref:GntR family transcriptional regulator n=1 Tax=Rhodovulum steppense TaxID=540251 RepID=A0A4R1Z0P4_9RHOB|nr:FCD domain-containing protein [Rhodovulum steppense]TCM87145.1 GntR family transcriptional regulator [Rhodovulum steppense]
MPPATTPSRHERLSRPQHVAEAIKTWVMENGWQPGDRLPSEVELIDRFGMAKGTIREAIRILEAQGLVRSRTGPGGGVFVHRVSDERATALLGNYFYFQKLTIDDIYQIREALEPELAAALAGRLSPAQLASLRAVMADYAEPAASAEQERDQHVASLRFHALLADISDNPLLRFLIRFTANMLSDITVSRRLYVQPNRELWASGLDYQSRLLAALSEGDATAARKVMTEHMRNARRLMRQQEAVLTQRFLPEGQIL